MTGRLRANTRLRWKEHLSACFCRGVTGYKEGLGLEDCPYTGKGVDMQRAREWIKGFRSSERRYGKLRK